MDLNTSEDKVENISSSTIEMEEIKDIQEKNSEEAIDTVINYKEKYRSLKRKLKCLLYEQECFHEELRKAQRKCLRASRDKSFLLDKLLQYEKTDDLTSDSEATDSSSDEETTDKKTVPPKVDSKIIKLEPNNVALNKSPASANDKNTKKLLVGDKVRCKKTENDHQCRNVVSTKVKSGLCYTHRQQLSAEKQSIPPNVSTSLSTPTPHKSSQNKPIVNHKKPIGGKDIQQIQELLEGSSNLSDSSPLREEDYDDELVIDLP